LIDALSRYELWKKGYWDVPDGIDTADFDFDWRPHPQDKPYIHHFGTQWQSTGGPKFVIPEHEGIVIHDEQTVIKLETEPKYYIKTTLQDLIKEHPNEKFWAIYPNVDTTGFDFSWYPDPLEEPYIHHFGTQLQQIGGVSYVLPDQQGSKLQSIAIVKQLPDPIYKIETSIRDLIKEHPNENFWAVPKNIDTANFDFDWRPDSFEGPFNHKFGTQWQMSGGPTYIMQNSQGIKFNLEQIALRLDNDPKYEITTTLDDLIKEHPNETFWAIYPRVDVSEFDFSWHPDPLERPYLHHFGTQWQQIGGVSYVLPNNEGIKLQNFAIVKQLPDNVYAIETTLEDLIKEHQNETFWAVPKNVETKDFDFDWRPDPFELPFIHHFGTQWQSTGGPTYVVKGYTGSKYQSSQQAKILPNKTLFTDLLEVANFDYSWHHDMNDPPYIYVFGNQWHDAMKMPTVIYTVPGATVKKYIYDNIATLAPNNTNFVNVSNREIEVDYSWLPDPDDPPFIYVFGNQWHDAIKMPTVEYVVEGATERKYMSETIARLLGSTKNYHKITEFDFAFDYSWAPDPYDPPYIYVFSIAHDFQDRIGNVLEYRVPEATEYKYMTHPVALDNANSKKYYIQTTLEDLINEHPNEIFWALNGDLKYNDFNFSWVPEKSQYDYIHVFGNVESKNLQTYFVNAPRCLAKELQYNYIDEQQIEGDTNLSKFYIDKGNVEGVQRFNELKKRYPDIQKTRYINNWIDTIGRCVAKAETKLFWILSSEIDYSNFEFNFYPSTWQHRMIHVFGTQWGTWGYTYLVNKDQFLAQSKHVKQIEHMSNLNFVKNKITLAKDSLYDVVLIDFGNDVDSVRNAIQSKVSNRKITTIEYPGNYYDIFKTLCDTLPVLKEHHVWICSSICDYSDFDFGYVREMGTNEYLHVFPSNRQKYGDTFLANINELRKTIEEIKTLGDYEKLNFNNVQRTQRLNAPTTIIQEDTHVNALNDNYDFPYEILVTNDNADIEIIDEEPMPVWNFDKDIIITSHGASRIIVPKEAKSYIKKELYDYPYIVKSKNLINSKPLDIIFFSNGEACAEENYEHLLNLTSNLPNKVLHIKNVKGRVNSQHAAANASNTPWYFLVNGKLEVDKEFDFNWQPDRLQIPKHYIFLATNPLNGLEYGHQAIVANNKKLTLNTVVTGLDFTMDSEHEIVSVNSGIGKFNTSPWDTWRTAFREVIKLKNYTELSNDTESKYRLNRWLTVANGLFSDYCIKGANDAVKYYEEVDGNMDKLMLTYDWEWLYQYYQNN
jgi:hypothetical protein